MLETELTRKGIDLQTPTTRELAMVLFRQRKVFVGVALVVVAGAIFYLFAGTRYNAEMQVLVRPGRADTPVTAQENAPVDSTRMAITEEELNSEVELLKDEDVLRKVVEENGLTRRDWLHFLRPKEGESAQVERATRRLASRISVEPMKKTDLIAVSYGSEDPAAAARVLRSLAGAYLEKHKEVHRPAGESNFFEEQTRESREQLEAAELALMQFAASHGIVAAGQQRDLALQQMSNADAGYRQTQIELTETQRRVEVLQAQLALLPERTTTQIRTADNPELLKSLKATLLELELKRTGLLTKFEPNHVLVQEVVRQIEQAKAAIAGETTSPVRDETTDKNPNYEWAKAELQHEQVHMIGLRAKAEATRTEIGEYQAMTRQLGDDAVTQDELISSEKAALENHLLYVKKQEEAHMDDALDTRGIVNVAIAEEPVAPALPAWSSLGILMVGFAVAGACGTAAAFAADYMDPALRTPDEVLAYLDVAVLASLPKMESPKRISAWRVIS